MKRFGIEGAESLIPLVDSLIQNCGISGAEQICFGMAHRGRLNLLVNVLGKPPTELFSEFEEDFELTGDNTGDVNIKQTKVNGKDVAMDIDSGAISIGTTGTPQNPKVNRFY